MRRRLRFAGGAASLALAGLLLGAAPPPASGPLPGGGRYVTYEDPGSRMTAIDLWFRAPAAGYDLAHPGTARAALAAIAASSSAGEEPLSSLVTRIGGTLTYDAYPDLAMVGAVVPATHAAETVQRLTDAYFNGRISAGGFHAGIEDAALAAARLPYEPDLLLQNDLFEALFASGPGHALPLDTIGDVQTLTQDGLRAYASRAFCRTNAVLSISGDATSGLIADVAASPAGAASPLSSAPSTSRSEHVVNGKEGAIGYAWIGPGIGDERAATAMDFLADRLFAPGTGTLTRAIRSAHPNLDVNGQFVTLDGAGVMLVTISGRGASSAAPALDAAVAASAKAMDGAAFQAARNAFTYRLLAQNQTPAGRADNFGWYAAEGNAGYAPGNPAGNYQRAIDGLDPAYVASIASRYLQHPVVVRMTTLAPGSESPS